MAQDHPFTINIEPHLEAAATCFRWRIYENGQLREQSSSPHASKRAAFVVANKAMRRLLTNWQTGK
jgi:hypothetical protein